MTRTTYPLGRVLRRFLQPEIRPTPEGSSGAVGPRAVGTLAVLCFAATASAQVVVDSTTGHAYQRVAAVLSWDGARVAAEQTMFGGVPGHLATITSQTEQEFIVANLGGSSVRGCWLGGIQAPLSVEPAGGWAWITGEPWSYAHWDIGEPNNLSGVAGGTHENCLQFKGNGTWNDLWGGATDTNWVFGYVIEWEPSAFEFPVRDPSTGHVYQRVPMAVTWDTARMQSERSLYGGRAGHLATVTSQAEQDFLTSTLGADALRGCWLGGVQPAGAPEPGGGWTWVTGEAWSYSNWDIGEPDDLPGVGGGAFENALQFNATGSYSHWNDLWADSADPNWVFGYIVEWEPVSFSPVVVDPTTGHAYQRVTEALKWDVARITAEQTRFGGNPGHLATITSATEQNFAVANLGGNLLRGCWIGGIQPPGSPEPGGGWTWITGEAWSYTAWATSEPSNSSGVGGGTHENCLQYKASNNNTRWNDVWGETLSTSWVFGYIVEWDPWVIFCSGDGSGTACPCGNSGIAGNGCSNSVFATGAHLGATGLASISGDTVVLSGTGMPNSSALYFQGTTQANAGSGTAFGDGLRCAAGAIIRLGTKINTGNQSSYPGGGDLPISVRGAITVPGTRTYQVWYRNAAAFCQPETFNLTNGIRAAWGP